MSGTVAVVPIRAGSKGLPGKNFRTLDGLPLWERAARQGARIAERVIVTTDADEILARDGTVPFDVLKRPPALAQDDTPMAPVLMHALDGLDEDTTVVLLQATSPLRSDEDVRAAMAHFRDGDWSMVMSVTHADSGVLKWGRAEGGRFLPLGQPGDCFANRQQLPPVFRPNGAVYVFAAGAFLRERGFPASRIGVTVIPSDRALDIDDAASFEAAERWIADQAPRSG